MPEPDMKLWAVNLWDDNVLGEYDYTVAATTKEEAREAAIDAHYDDHGDEDFDRSLMQCTPVLIDTARGREGRTYKIVAILKRGQFIITSEEGFWNNQQGWVENKEDATTFYSQELNLPIGKNVRWEELE